MSQNSTTKTILLVEDEALLALGTQSILERNGYTAIHVLNGEKAIETVEEKNIDLILMDIDLGRNKMDGTEAAEDILQNHTLPIIFHTSHSEREMVEKVKGITRYGYVLKNAGEFVLLESIQMAFELFRANQQIAEKEERYKYMFDYNRSGVAVLKVIDDGSDFVFVDYNTTAEEIDKIPKEDVIGNRITEVFPGVRDFGILDVFREVWETGESKTHSDAFYQDKRISGWRDSFVYRIPSGEIVSVYRDVTEEKETENKLEVTSHELEYLHRLSRLVETEGITLSAILQGTVDLLPNCIGEAGNMNVRLTINGNEYVTAGFQESHREVRLPIFVGGEKAGDLEIFCNRKKRHCIKEKYPEEFTLFLESLPKSIGRIIERIEAVEELRERKENYRYILESIGDGVISTDIKGNITRTNHIARELLGCADADLRGKPLYDAFTLHNSRDGKLLPNPVETVIATDEMITLSNHTKLVSKWGTEIQIADSVAPVHDGRGETQGAVLVFRDETEKYEQEKKLRESEEQYRRLFENMAEGFVRTNTGGEIILVNQAAVELCGYDSVADLTGRPMTDFYVDPSERSGLLAQLKKEKHLRNREFLLKKKNGETIWTLCNIKMVPDENGDFFGTEAIFRDYTDKKIVELERERHERFLGSILNAIQDPVSVHDGDLNIKMANNIVHAMYSDREPLECKKCYTAYHGRSTPCEECPTLKAFTTKQVHSCMKEISGEGGGKHCFELFAYPIIDAEGAVESVVEYARDITELVEREKELQKSNNRFQALFNNTSVMLAIDPETGEILHANASALNFYGYSYEELSSMRIQDINMLSEEEVQQEMAAAAAEKKTYFNFQHRLASGEVRDVEVYSGKVGWGEKDVLCSVIHDVTGRKRLEAALHISDGYYRNVLQFLPVYVLDREYRYLHVNDLAAELVHIKAEELAGKKITDFFPGFKETDFYKIYKKVMETREEDSLTASFTLPGGTPGVYQVHVLPCSEGIQCIAVDITERKNAEELLQKTLAESEELKRVVNNSPVCVFTWRNEEGWPVEYVSENVKNLVGYNAENFISGEITLSELIHADDFARTKEEVTRNLNIGKWEYAQEYRLIHKDGSVIWVEDRTFVESDEAGNFHTIHGLVWDISERKNAANSLRIQQRYEKAIAAASRALLTVQSEREAIQKALTELRDVTAVSRLYIFENFYDPADGLCMRQTYEVCAPGIGPEIDNPVLQHVVYKNGFSRWVYVLSSGNAICGNVKDFPQEERKILEPQGIVTILVIPMFVNGEWKGFIGFDEIEREYLWRRSEALLLQTASDLIGGYLGRMESEKIIQRQLQEKELLIRETHHRIKNNIASIYGLLHLHAEQIENEEARSIVNEAVSRVNSMKDLYEKMLSSDDVRVVSAAPYINDLIDSIMTLFSHQADVTVYKRIADFTLDSDSLFLLGIIVNEVITNTMKYAFAGRETGTIRVYCEKTDDRVSLIIRDDGIGLPEGFDAEQASGLGTSLVIMLTRQLDGTVTFESENGTKVRVDFFV